MTRRLLFQYFLTLGISIFHLGTVAVAAEIFHTPLTNKETGFITVFGELEAGDEKKFNAIAQQYRKAAVLFSSPGGNLIAGIEIGRTIRLRNFGTGVAPNTLCASACALAWLGGTNRYLDPTSKIGFHAAYIHNGGTNRETGVGNAIVGAYVTQLALPVSAVIYITKASPDDMTWLTADEARRVGIDVEILIVPPHEGLKRIRPERADSVGPLPLKETVPLGPNQQWLVVGSRAALPDAMVIAKKYKSEFPETMIVTARNGHYAVTLGRVVRDQEALSKLKRDGRVPQDAYFTKGVRLDSVVWR